MRYQRNELFKKLNRQTGQGLVEYVLILSFVSIGVIALLTLFGVQVSTLMGRAAGV